MTTHEILLAAQAAKLPLALADTDTKNAALEAMGLSGVKLSAFASGDSSYTHFCGAVDAIEAKGKDLGAQIVAEGLKVDGTVSDAPDAVQEFAAAVLAAL